MALKNGLISLARPFVQAFPRLATMYRGVRDQLDSGEARVTPWGFLLAGNEAMEQGTFEPTETELVRKILGDVDVLVNVGANVGYYCCHALSMEKSVIAFEPIPRNLRYLCRNLQSNGWSGTEVYPIALSNTVGVLEMYGGNTGASIVKGWAGIPDGYQTLVPSSTMDLVLGTRLEGKRMLILVDIEGAEQWMLEGATIMLGSTPRPTWVVEVATTEHQPSGVALNPNLRSTFGLFFQHGYKAFTFDREMRAVTLEDIDLVLSGKQKFSTHNFVFSESRLAL